LEADIGLHSFASVNQRRRPNELFRLAMRVTQWSKSMRASFLTTAQSSESLEI